MRASGFSSWRLTIQPADEAGGDPHHHRQQDQQDVDRADRRRRRAGSAAAGVPSAIGATSATVWTNGHRPIVVAQHHASAAAGQLEIEVGARARDEGEVAQRLAAEFGNRLRPRAVRRTGSDAASGRRARSPRSARTRRPAARDAGRSPGWRSAAGRRGRRARSGRAPSAGPASRRTMRWQASPIGTVGRRRGETRRWRRASCPCCGRAAR